VTFPWSEKKSRLVLVDDEMIQHAAWDGLPSVHGPAVVIHANRAVETPPAAGTAA
jgi:hypothetical protein